MKSFIDPNLPLGEIHRHLDGAVRLQTILDLGKQHNLRLPAWDLEGLRPYVQVMDQQPGVMAFLARFEWMIGVMVDTEAIRRIAYENVEDCKNEGMDFVELRFSPWFMASAHGLDPAAVVGAAIDGVRQGERDFGLIVKLTGIISRTYGPENGLKELEALLVWKDQITALDLAGDEAHWPGNLFVNHFERAQQAGWHITIHAGESDGPHSVWQAVSELGAERLGHAVHAVEDPQLIDFLRERGIGIESNLTSNVQTSTVKNYPDHPLKFFLESGLKATINTDDPGISAIDLPYEYDVAAPAAGLTPAMIRQAQQNAFQAAFLTEQERREILTKKSSFQS